ncbi:hypothetical protein KY284_002575 [Solanum tuberosum]|nr:hypothetical protein KY284_002575 [Solanum tuberosum]
MAKKFLQWIVVIWIKLGFILRFRITTMMRRKLMIVFAKKVGKRLFNGNCIVFGELASGFVDVMVDCALDPYDFLALVPVVEGVVTDWEGNELIWNASTPVVPEGGFKIVATAGKTTHQHVISALSQ